MAISTYYFDGSDAVASNTGVGTDWSNTTYANDGNTTTDATVTLGVFGDSKELLIEGTNAPSSGGTISQVRARVYGMSPAGTSLLTDITTDGDGEELYSNIPTNLVEGWTDYYTLSTPTGGWTWTKIQSLESRCLGNGGFDGGSITLSRIEIEVTSENTTSPFPSFRRQ